MINQLRSYEIQSGVLQPFDQYGQTLRSLNVEAASPNAIIGLDFCEL
jgi:hypothetical protein